MMQSVEGFSGVWKRTVLYEPVGVLGPEEEQLKNVIWVQSRNGTFIDIRYQEGVTIHSKMKSFAGEGSFVPSTSLFTWRRDFDFRPPGAPDVGLMRVLKGSCENPLQLEEDGVLPGDDYREIWDKLSPSSDSTDCTVRLYKKSPEDAVEREGLFLIVGSWFAVTLARPHSEAGAQQLQSLFASGSTTEEVCPEESYVWTHVCAMGSSVTWQVQYALHSAMRGDCLLPGQCAHPALAQLFDNSASNCGSDSNAGTWHWEVVHGVLPAAIASAVHSPS